SGESRPGDAGSSPRSRPEPALLRWRPAATARRDAERTGSRAPRRPERMARVPMPGGPLGPHRQQAIAGLSSASSALPIRKGSQIQLGYDPVILEICDEALSIAGLSATGGAAFIGRPRRGADDRSSVRPGGGVAPGLDKAGHRRYGKYHRYDD